MKTFNKIKAFKAKFAGTVSWRLKRHCSVIDKHINPNEELLYAFCGQLNDHPLKIFDTGIVAITSERLIVAQNYIWPGYKFVSITPDMYNDCTVKSGIIWGAVGIETIKETVWVSNLSKKALPEIETIITTFMQEMKKKYPPRDED
ncbi:MAG: PH domain-containing protein [Bacilli bacterium]|nr:PH domain-containing protein [Bacilli bacterium]